MFVEFGVVLEKVEEDLFQGKLAKVNDINFVVSFGDFRVWEGFRTNEHTLPDVDDFHFDVGVWQFLMCLDHLLENLGSVFRVELVEFGSQDPYDNY